VSAAREEVLARIRAALADRPCNDQSQGTVAPGHALAAPDPIERFVERVAEYRAAVVVTADARDAARRVLSEHGARRVGIAPDLPGELRPDGLELVEDTGLTPAELDALDGALTACAAACAETGTLALDGGPGQGRRALTLVPDLHVCVVRAADVVATVPALFARLEPSARAGRPIVLVSGPSATSDIELIRVEGVHGPRRLVVIVDERP